MRDATDEEDGSVTHPEIRQITLTDRGDYYACELYTHTDASGIRPTKPQLVAATRAVLKEALAALDEGEEKGGFSKGRQALREDLMLDRPKSTSS
jgi:hypothetical protein